MISIYDLLSGNFYHFKLKGLLSQKNTDAHKDVVKISGDKMKTNNLKKDLNRSTYDTSDCVLLTEQTL